MKRNSESNSPHGIRSYGKITLVVALLSVVLSVSAVYQYRDESSVSTRYVPLLNFTNKFKMRLATATVSFQDALLSPNTKGLENVRRQLQQLNDSFARFTAPQNAAAAPLVKNTADSYPVIAAIQTNFRRLQDLLNVKPEASTSLTTSELRLRYMSAFNTTLQQLDSLEMLLQNTASRELQHSRVLHRGKFFLFMLILILMPGMVWRFEKRHQEDYGLLLATNEQLRKSRHALAEAQEIAQLGSWELDLRSNRLTWSDEIYRIFGVEPQAFGATYEAFLETVHPDDRDFVDKAYRESLKNKTPYNIVHRLLLRDGQIKYVNERCKTFYGPDGQPERSVGTVHEITAQMETEKALQMQIDRTQKLLQTTQDGYILADTGGQVLDVNPAYCKMVGYNRDELLKMSIADLEALLSPAEIEQRVQQILEQGTARFETRHHHKSGEAIDLDVSVSIIQQNHTPLVAAFVRDITERNRMDAALRASEEKYRSLVENAADFIAIVGLDRKLQFLNRTSSEEFDMQTVLGSSMFDYIQPEYHETVRECLARVQKTGTIGEYEIKAQITPDDYSWYSTRVSPIKRDGKVVAFTLISTDITKQKTAEHKIREAESKFRSLVEQSLSGVYIIQDDMFKYANPKLADMFGYSQDDLMQSIRPEDLVHEDDRTRVAENLRKRLRGEVETIRYTFRGLHKNGQIIDVEVHGTRAEFEGKAAVIGMALDITERKRAETALRDSQIRYQRLFENAPISLWEEDFSQVKKHLDSLRVKNLRRYLETHPEEVLKCAALVKIVDINQATLDLYKAKSKEDILRGLPVLFTEQSLATFREELIQMYRGMVNGEFEAVNRTLTGEERVIILRWNIQPEHEDSWGRTLVSILDITDKKQMEMSLQRSQEQLALHNRSLKAINEIANTVFRTLNVKNIAREATRIMMQFTGSPSVGVFQLDKEKQRLDYLYAKGVSRETRRNIRHLPVEGSLSGVAVQTARVATTLDLQHDERLEPAVKASLTTEKMHSAVSIPLLFHEEVMGVMNLIYKHRQVLTREEEETLMAIGKTIGLAMANARHVARIEKEIVERKLAEKALLDSEQRYRNLVSAAPIGIAILRDEHVVYANQEACRLAGAKSPAELIGRSIRQFIHPDYLQESVERVRQFTAGKIRRFSGENRYVRLDGTDFPVEVTMVRVQFHGQNALQLLVRDITLQKQHEIEMRRSREQLRALATHLQSVREEERTAIAREIHDEFGQILSVLKMDLAFMENKLQANCQDETVQNITNDIESMNSLIDQTAVKTANLITRLRPEVLDNLGLVAAMEWQSEDFQRQFGIECQFFSDVEDIVLNDEQQTAIYRIFQEALTNVARHAGAGKVTVELRRSGNRLHLKVSDDGTGIPDKSRVKPNRFGIIGMHERAHLLGGTLKISGRRPKGTTVSLVLPLRPEGAGGEKEEKQNGV